MARDSITKVAVAALLLAAVLAACSPARPSPVASGSGTASPVASAPAASGTPSVNPTWGDVSFPAPGKELRVASCPGFRLEAPPKIEPGKSYVLTLVNAQRGYGPDCPILQAGRTCRIRFAGSWSIVETPKGYLVFQIYEGDGDKPKRNLRYGPVGPRGQLDNRFELPYTVPEGVKRLTFRTLLLDLTGRVVAAGQSQTIPIPSCLRTGED